MIPVPTEMMSRRNRILDMKLRPDVRGLEIGPRHAPLIDRNECRVRYVDYTDTESLRASQFDPSIRLEDIVDVDVVWGDRPLAEVIGSPVDFVVASHVVEHVPDLVGWLAEIRDVLVPDGRLGLAVPDRRSTFDRWRYDSRIPEVLEAYLLGSKRPTLRQIIDASFFGVDVDQADEGTVHARMTDALPERIKSRIMGCWNLVSDVERNPRYVDAHCWVFTPGSLLENLELLARLRLLPFRLEALDVPQPAGHEFFVRLRAADSDDPEVLGSIERCRLMLPALPPSELADSGELQRLRVEAEMLRARLDEIKASTSWRATEPVRRFAVALKRLVR